MCEKKEKSQSYAGDAKWKISGIESNRTALQTLDVNVRSGGSTADARCPPSLIDTQRKQHGGKRRYRCTHTASREGGGSGTTVEDVHDKNTHNDSDHEEEDCRGGNLEQCSDTCEAEKSGDNATVDAKMNAENVNMKLKYGGTARLCFVEWQAYVRDIANIRLWTLKLLRVQFCIATRTRAFAQWTERVRFERRRRRVAVMSCSASRARRLKRASLLAFGRHAVLSKLIRRMVFRAARRLLVQSFGVWRKRCARGHRGPRHPSNLTRATMTVSAALSPSLALQRNVFDVWRVLVGAARCRHTSILAVISTRRSLMHVNRCMVAWKAQTFAQTLFVDPDEDDDEEDYLEPGPVVPIVSGGLASRHLVQTSESFSDEDGCRVDFFFRAARDALQVKRHKQLMLELRINGFRRDVASNHRRSRLIQIAMYVWALACYASRTKTQVFLTYKLAQHAFRAWKTFAAKHHHLIHTSVSPSGTTTRRISRRSQLAYIRTLRRKIVALDSMPI